MTGGSGQVVHRHFCANCGSGVVNEADVLPGTIVVLAGTLDDPTICPNGRSILQCRSALAERRP
jgi:hypothetical protein